MRSSLQNAFFAAALLVATSCLTRGQGNFQNLGFESATLVPIPGDPYGSVQFAAAFPGWTGLVGGTQQTNALYNNVFLSVSTISIIDSGWSYPSLGGVIQGNYTAILQGGVPGHCNDKLPCKHDSFADQPRPQHCAVVAVQGLLSRLRPLDSPGGDARRPAVVLHHPGERRELHVVWREHSCVSRPDGRTGFHRAGQR